MGTEMVSAFADFGSETVLLEFGRRAGRHRRAARRLQGVARPTDALRGRPSALPARARLPGRRRRRCRRPRVRSGPRWSVPDPGSISPTSLQDVRRALRHQPDVITAGVFNPTASVIRSTGATRSAAAGASPADASTPTPTCGPRETSSTTRPPRCGRPRQLRLAHDGTAKARTRLRRVGRRPGDLGRHHYLPGRRRNRLYSDCPLQRRFRDIHALGQHFIVPRDTLVTAGAFSPAKTSSPWCSDDVRYG